MITLTLDFETFYGSGFSLTNLATAEYVGDEKFAVMGVGLAVDDGPVEFFFEEDLPRFRELLDSLPPDVTLVCHNTLFDGYILHKMFNWYPMRYACTQSMSRGMFPNQSASLDNLTKRLWPNDPSMHKGKELVQFRNKRHLTEEEKVIYKRYCSQDVAITRAAYNLMLPHYPPTELDIIDLTCRMFCQPVAKLDVELLERALTELEAERYDLIHGGGIPETVLSSNTQFTEYLLREHGIEIPKKVSLTTGKETEALSKNDIAFNELQAQHPELEHIWNARIAAKSVGEITRCKRFLSVAQASGGELAAPLIYYAAHTGRYGGCLTADTKVIILRDEIIRTVNIVDVLITDKVWDGIDFVEHEGVVFSGTQKVITHDGITGTPNHPVSVDGRFIPLEEAAVRGSRIDIGELPKGTWGEMDQPAANEFKRQRTNNV